MPTRHKKVALKGEIMHVQTYNHGVLQAAVYSGSLREPLGEIQTGIAVAQIAPQFMLPYACAYQWPHDPMLTQIMSVSLLHDGGPRSSHTVCIPLAIDTHCVVVPELHTVVNYLLGVDMTAYGGFETDDEAERRFLGSMMSTDILFWQGLTVGLSQMDYILMQQLPAQGFTHLDEGARRVLRQMKLPPAPHGVSEDYYTEAFRIGRNSSFQCARAIVRELPNQQINTDLTELLHERCGATFPAYPGKDHMRNLDEAIPFVDMPE